MFWVELKSIRLYCHPVEAGFQQCTLLPTGAGGRFNGPLACREFQMVSFAV